MSEAATVFRTFSFEWQNKTWELRRPSLGTERAFATYMEREDTKWAVRQKTVSYEAYKDALSIAREAASANDYGWCRPGFLRSLSDVEHTSQFFFYWFAQCYSESHDLNIPTVKAMRDMYVAQKIGQPAGESPLDKLLTEALTDPNPLPPV